jgi:predicted SnoaL-like aldol condensation-catalyzing enzyme
MMNSHKATAELFLKLACSDVARAYRELTAPNFRHHNVWFPPDPKSLEQAMEENLRQHPEKKIEIKQSIEEGDRVAVISHVTFGPNDRGYALAHVFRFEGDRIAEMWDLAQEIPETSPNTDGPF